ncbi:MAG TPA: hypothetical protein VEB59_11735, partial [Gemmatimonadales bacterium]|nr:hypothetical protein [Gemmatimonadales bacterium]
MPLTKVWFVFSLAFPAPQMHAPDTVVLRPVAAAPSDSMLLDVRGALARGRPWQASRLVAPALADSARRTASAVYLAAQAASEWNGWPEVGRLLEGEQWLDTLFGGRGRLLLARSALEARRDSLALAYALAAAPSTDAQADAERLVLLARALERVGARDSAAATFRRAAERVPAAADWLILRAAAVTDDSASRAALYHWVRSPVARERTRWADAAAFAAIGDRDRAAREYRALGARLTALRLRLEMSGDSAPRAAIRRELVGVAAAGGAAQVRGAVALLDSLFAPLTPAEELAVARAAGEAGLAARAAQGYVRAFEAGLGNGEDRFDYATALTKLGRNGEAAFQFNLVRAPRTIVPMAAYLRARSLVRDGQLAEGRSALLDIGQRYPRDTSAASSALFLLGDLAADDRADRLARTYYRRAAVRYPTSRYAAASRFRAAMVELLTGDPAMSAREFDELARR